VLPLALAALTLAAPGEVRLSVQAGAACELDRVLGHALEEHGVGVRDGATALLSVTATDGNVTLTLLDGRGVLRGQRQLPAGEDDCAVLPQSIALLARVWLDAVPVVVAAPQPAPRPHREAPPRPAIIAVAPAPVLTPPQPPPDEPLTEDALSAPPLPERLSPEATATPPPPVETVASPPPPQRRRALHTFSLSANAGGAMAPADMPVAQFFANFDVGFYEPWGVAVDGGFETPRNIGGLSSQLGWAGLSLRRAFFFFSDTTGLYVSLGARLVRFHASLDLLQMISSTDLLSAAGVLQLEWRQVLVAGLFLSASVQAQARLRAEHFSANGTDLQFLVPPWGFALSGGVGWTLP
jgi:hypothetical protein